MEQPAPQPNDREHVQRRAIDQLTERYQYGVEHYKTGLQIGNGRKMIKDLREELQDALIYATGVEMGLDEVIRTIRHVIEMHYEFQGVCNICKQSAPCHTRVDLEKTLEILGEIRPN